MKCLVTGITGQDGSYLAELLIAQGHQVHGIVRRASTFGTERIDPIFERLYLHHGDMTDASALSRLVRAIEPDEVYNLAAQSHVRVSFDAPIYTADSVALGTLRLLEAVRDAEQAMGRRIRFYQASSSEMFGSSPPPQRETTPFHPRSPYACAKAMAHYAAVNYRESYGMHVCCGILFNHESPRRGETFVTRKITRAVGRIAVGLQDTVALGNLDARRDWGHARDYVEAMVAMLRHDEPDDYVVATGEMHSVREFAERAFERIGRDWREHVRYDERYLRPAEVSALCGDARKAREVLGWTPRTSFDELVAEMVDHDIELAERERTLLRGGHAVLAPAGV